MLSISLRRDGYEVFSAEDGETGLGLFRREMPPLVLVDIKMPGMDGIEVLKRIKGMNPETEVIIITGHGDMDSAIQALQFDASDFITKPVKGNALSVALKRAEERLDLRRKLAEYTYDLENMVEAATEEIKRRYEFEDKLIQSSIDGIVATDEKGNIIIFNRGAEKILGYSRSKVIKRMDIRDLYPAEIAEQLGQMLYGKEKKQEALAWKDISVMGKNGRNIPVRFSGTIIRERGEVIGSVGFFHDLREIKKLEQELIQSERLAAIGQTVAGLAHYIKNILNGLKGGAYVVNTAIDKEDMSQFKTGWDMIERNIGRVSNLVLDLLSYSKEHEPEYQKCLASDIANDVCKLMDFEAREHHIEIIRNFDQSIGEVSLDPKDIHRCLLNLVSNAVDACIFDPDRRKVWKVKISTALEGDKTLIFEISDNGCGMDEEVRKKLFTSFFSTKGGRGTGLGLLVTQKIIKEHGGTIAVDSQLGKGSRFIIRLPYTRITNGRAMQN